jgi:hypothetical protein
MPHRSGQTISPVFEGWEPNSDGTFSLYFGYMNRNYEEELDIPIGPNNMMEPGPDGGPPTHFLTRRHKNVFRVIVPKDFGDKTIVWTLSIRGKTETVTGSLNPLWEIEVSRDPRSGNTPPVVSVGRDQTITLPASATLTAAVTDDGLPKTRWNPNNSPEAASVGGTPGIAVEWSKYRGPGNVTFAPAKQTPVDGKATTTATFDAPGVYLIRVVADDGTRVRGWHCCWTNGEVKVTVNPGASAPSGR